MSTALSPTLLSSTTAIDSDARVCGRIFWGWLTLRTIAWTLFAAIALPNAPLDLIEWLSWGHEWRWGYHKHPPLPAWIAEIFSYLSPGDVWGVYLASYLSIAIGFICAWKLGREMLPPKLALFGALSLEGLIFLSYDGAEFSNNVVLVACWALAVLALFRAIETDSFGWWLALGTAAGMGLLTKYSIGFLLLPMAGFLVLHPAARKCWRRPGPYLAGLTAFAIFLPHLIWMVQHHFATLTYALERSEVAGGWFNHFKNPMLFVLSQVSRLLPVFFVLVPFTGWRWRARPVAVGERYNRSFLAAMVVAPVLLHLAFSLVTGAQLREIWGIPLWTFVGVTVLIFVRSNANEAAWRLSQRYCGFAIVGFAIFAFAKVVVVPIFLKHPSRVHFPGKRLTDEVVRLWQDRVGQPLPLAVGECWLASNVGCYANPRPSVYFSTGMGNLAMDPEVVPWTGDEDVRRRGGVLLWDAAAFGDRLPKELRERFPEAEEQPPLVLGYQCWAKVPAAHVGLAIQLPRQQRSD